jgi:hypothetical protein
LLRNVPIICITGDGEPGYCKRGGVASTFAWLDFFDRDRKRALDAVDPYE